MQRLPSAWTLTRSRRPKNAGAFRRSGRNIPSGDGRVVSGRRAKAGSQNADAIATQVIERGGPTGDGHDDGFAGTSNLGTVTERPRNIRRGEPQPTGSTPRRRERVGVIQDAEHPHRWDGARSIEGTANVLMVDERVREGDRWDERRHHAATDGSVKRIDEPSTVQSL